MNPFKPLTSTVVPLLVNDIDTDQIIPARFLKVIDKLGLGNNLFCDWRYLPDGTPDPAFILNQPDAQKSQILLAGDNFGCGSSREHAPWALSDYGFRVIISTSFADIFYNNSLKNGLLPVVIPAEKLAQLVDWLQNDPTAQVTVDLESKTVHFPFGETVEFPIDSFSRYCLIKGVDEMGYLLSFSNQIVSYENSR
jgi:3-isopropylmalate/(R)-2-methylmalate dehydratase small subunit